MRKALRFVSGSLWLAAMLSVAGVDYVLTAAGHGFKPSLAVRTRLLQRNARRVLRVFARSVYAAGPLPKTGLLVSNTACYAAGLCGGQEGESSKQKSSGSNRAQRYLMKRISLMDTCQGTIR